MNIFSNIEFLNKYYFILLIIIPLFIYLYYKKRKYIKFSYFDDLQKVFRKNSLFFYIKLFLISILVSLMVLIIANPNSINTDKHIKKNGIDIMLLLDVSPSMDTPDLKPSRIEVAKKVIWDFISNAKTDRLWLVVFSWKPFTSIPLTFDYNILKETISNITTQTLRLNWTNIWDSILLAKNIFEKQIKKEDFKKRQKVIILVTDGDSNVWIDPIIAAKAASDDWIKIYTIWIWWRKPLFISWLWIIPPLNATTLKKIAQVTWWEFFRADSNYSFQRIFDKLKTLQSNDIEVEIKKQYSQEYYKFAMLLLFIFSIYIFLVFAKIEK